MDTHDAKRLAGSAKNTAGDAAGEDGVTSSGTRHGSPLHRLGQVGYAAQGLVWILVGWLALAAARGGWDPPARRVPGARWRRWSPHHWAGCCSS